MKGYSFSHDKIYVALDILAEMLTGMLTFNKSKMSQFSAPSINTEAEYPAQRIPASTTYS